MIRERIDGLVVDLDGVLYRGDRPIEGAAEAIERYRRAGAKMVFCTNNSRYTDEQYLDKLARMGVEIDPSELLTSARVTAEVLAARGCPGPAIVVGGEGLRAALASAGIELNDDPDDERAEVVAVGWDPSFDYLAMRRASSAVRAGAVFVASNADATFPAATGLWPGAGSILASIETAAGRRAEVMGKPNPPMMDAAEARLRGARSIAIVGDRADTDLEGGRGRGWATILVLSGVTSAAEAAELRPQPDLVLPSIADLRIE